MNLVRKYKKVNFWKGLKKPFFCLAPMSDVTDVAFRTMLAKYGKPDVMWTEFISADGLCNTEGRKKLAHILKYNKKEKPLVVQIFGANPVNIKKACQFISKFGPSKGRAGFDGIDINMGCPDKSVVRQGAGSALIKKPKLAREIIRAAISGANGLPVSVKTRVGFNKEEINTWIPELLKEDIKALTIHARTRKEMSKVSANWDYVKKVVALAKKGGKGILVIGNGDVVDIDDARRKSREANCDGVMIGRGVFGNPWFFNKKKREISVEDKLKVLLEHTKLFEKLLSKYKNFDVMKKHYKAYVNGFYGAKELRVKLMQVNSFNEVKDIIFSYMKK